MAPFLVAAVTAGSAWASSVWMNGKTLGPDGSLDPKLFGWDADWVLIGGGLLVAALFGPLIGAIGFGAVAAGAINMDTRKRTKQAAEAFVASSMAAHPAMLTDKGGGWVSKIPSFVAEALAQ